jgi:hypothetical protein
MEPARWCGRNPYHAWLSEGSSLPSPSTSYLMEILDSDLEDDRADSSYRHAGAFPSRRPSGHICSCCFLAHSVLGVLQRYASQIHDVFRVYFWS